MAAEQFEQQVTELLGAIKATPCQPGAEKFLIPSEVAIVTGGGRKLGRVMMLGPA